MSKILQHLLRGPLALMPIDNHQWPNLFPGSQQHNPNQIVTSFNKLSNSKCRCRESNPLQHYLYRVRIDHHPCLQLKQFPLEYLRLQCRQV